MEIFDFIIENNDGEKEGRFVWSNNCSKLFNQYYCATEIYEYGDCEKAINKFRYLIKKAVLFFPAMNDIGEWFIKKKKYSKALECFKMAYNISSVIIPKSFNGRILWSCIENRHYLRTLHGLGMAYYYLCEYDKTVKLFEQMLEYNPNDNQGIRYLIGNLYLLLGDSKKAEEAYLTSLDSPSVRYSYGLLLHNSKKYIEAILQFAFAIIEDEYIYNCIVHNKIDEPKDLFSAIKIKNAYDYYSLTFSLWYSNKSIETLNKLYKSDTFALYLEELNRLKNKLMKVDNTDNGEIKRRSMFLERIHEIRNIIDHDFASKIFAEIN